jgi:hypothetical protein
MKLWVRRLESFEDEARADREFWASMTPDERVAALEEIRSDWYKIHGGHDSGLRRVLRVVEKIRSV